MISSRKLHKELKIEVPYVAWHAIYDMNENGVMHLTPDNKAIRDIYLNKDFAKYVIGNSIVYDKSNYMEKLLKKITVKFEG